MTIDPNFGHHESCACLRPGDAMCNCGQIYDTPPAHGDGEVANPYEAFGFGELAKQDDLTNPTPEAQEARDEN